MARRCKLRLDPFTVASRVWPGQQHRVRLVGVRYSATDDVVEFEIEGDVLPDCERVHAFVATTTDTVFREG